MAVDLVNFQRRFQIWAYSVSHSQLLIRSNRSDDCPTRLDVLFKGVAAIKLPTLFDGFKLAEAPATEAAEILVESGAKNLHSQKVFLASGAGFSGYVIASVMFWHEDSGHHYDESHFQSSFMTRV